MPFGLRVLAPARLKA